MFFQGGKSEIFVDVIERMSVVIGSNVSDISSRLMETLIEMCRFRTVISLGFNTPETSCSSNRFSLSVMMICAAGSSDEGRRGGRDQSQVLHAELLR